MADTPRGLRCDSIMSMDDDGDQQQGLAGLMLSQSFASGSMTELSSLYSMSEDVSLTIRHYTISRLLDCVLKLLVVGRLLHCVSKQRVNFETV